MTTDKQREEFESRFAVRSDYPYDFDRNSHTGEYTSPVTHYAYQGYQAAQAVMFPEIDYLKSYIEGQDDSFATMMKKLSAANERIAELEERIRVADAEEPYGVFYQHGEFGNVTMVNDIDILTKGTFKLYLHAQIPDEEN